MRENMAVIMMMIITKNHLGLKKAFVHKLVGVMILCWEYYFTQNWREYEDEAR